MSKIVLLEDNPDWQDFAKEAATKAAGGDLIFETFETEYEFQQKLTAFASSPPNLFIIDVMVPWAEPSPNIVISHRKT